MHTQKTDVWGVINSLPGATGRAIKTRRLVLVNTKEADG